MGFNIIWYLAVLMHLIKQLCDMRIVTNRSYTRLRDHHLILYDHLPEDDHLQTICCSTQKLPLMCCSYFFGVCIFFLIQYKIRSIQHVSCWLWERGKALKVAWTQSGNCIFKKKQQQSDFGLPPKNQHFFQYLIKFNQTWYTFLFIKWVVNRKMYAKLHEDLCLHTAFPSKAHLTQEKPWSMTLKKRGFSNWNYSQDLYMEQYLEHFYSVWTFKNTKIRLHINRATVKHVL